ncbi:MAG: hypothetical protein QOG61_1937, partial [Candidatus Binataceae bacterium]|nr:hypothetical protein [Candidatus Binataceae bacterium]
MVTLKLEIPDDQAEALAQLCKRIDTRESATCRRAMPRRGRECGLWARAGADRGHRAASRCYANRVVLHRFPSCQA